MLVLSRRPGQSISIGDDVVIHVVRLSPNTVKIGIEAPKTCTILRSELQDIRTDATEESTTP